MYIVFFFFVFLCTCVCVYLYIYILCVSKKQQQQLLEYQKYLAMEQLTRCFWFSDNGYFWIWFWGFFFVTLFDCRNKNEKLIVIEIVGRAVKEGRSSPVSEG